MKYRIPALVAILFCLKSFAQPSDSNGVKRPKLVVGIVIDQMRWDYLYKFYSLYSETGGFKRLLNSGFSCDNTFIPYTPTVTAAGHASIFTGSVPAINGVVGNFWFDKLQNKAVYCTDDDTEKTVGANDAAGKMSPRSMVVTTVTDELRLATNFSSKVIGLSFKDRASIYPAGHTANGVYWYDPAIGNFITSSYYMNELPDWVKKFNARRLTDSFYNYNWELSLSKNIYKQYCGDDEQPYERLAFGAEQKHFPYSLNTFAGNDFGKIIATPFGNDLLELLAESAISNENLGRNKSADFLTLSFSSPDYIGHTFGSESWEQMDDYIKLDKTLGKFFSFLDKQVGTGNYLIFLTADHAVANSPGYAKIHNFPGGSFNEELFMNGVKQLMLVKYNYPDIIKGLYEDQVLLNHGLIDSLKLDEAAITKSIIDFAERRPGVARAFSLPNISNATLTEVQKRMYTNNYYPQRSGDIQIVLKPGYMAGDGLGTTHGTWNPYDSHIPLLWYGWGIKQGNTSREVYMTDIAATVAALLHIQMPGGCIGKVIEEVIK